MYVCPECGTSSAGEGRCPGDGAELQSGSDALLGQMVGSYRVARLMGVGGMGRVYKGVQPAIGSRVAIKILNEECARAPALVERFFAEARAVNVIRHESIVNIVDFAALPDGRPYLVMEYLDGEPLSAMIARVGALPLGSLAQLMTEVLGALAAAHDHGIIHRDLKPDNVFLTTGGRAKVLDFGVAKLKPGILEVDGATRTGALLGTPLYMSPEQAAGGAIDARADLYSVGVMLFEAATGKRPFEATTLYQLLKLHVEAPPPPPRSLRPDMPQPYESCILRALEKDPSRRYASARELASALGQASRYLTEAAFSPLRVASGPHGTSSLRSVQAPQPPRPAMSPTIDAPPVVSSSAGTPAMAYAPSPVLQTLPPPRRERSLLPYVVVGAVAVVVLGGLATVAAVMAVRSRAASPTPVAKVQTDDDAPVAQDPAVTSGPRARFKLELRNMKHFDPYAFLPRATKLARRHYPDAALTRLDAEGVHPDGTVDLTFGRSNVYYRFRSPSVSQPPPFAGPCMVYVAADGTGLHSYVPTNMECGRTIIGRPHCSLAAVWLRAVKNGAPSSNAVGTLGYFTGPDGKPRWNVDIPPGYNQSIPDNCR